VGRGGLRGQRGELFGRGETLADPIIHLAFVQHVYQFNADQGMSRRVERLAARYGTGDAFHCAMVLFHHIIEIFHLADKDGRARHCSS
jgi:hypothetical protein